MTGPKPTPEETVEPEPEQVYYTEDRDRLYQLVYVDEEVVLLRYNWQDDTANRIERRAEFDASVESGFFEHKPDSDFDLLEMETMDWSDVSYIGEKTNKNLHDAGYSTFGDIRRADDDELLAVSGLGAKGLVNLRKSLR